MTERRGAAEQAKEHAEKHARWRTKYALEQAEELRKKGGKDIAYSKFVVDEANYWLDDVELRKGQRVEHRYKRDGADVRLDAGNPFERGDKGDKRLPPPGK